MALSDGQIRELWENYSPTQGIASFARSVEAEVRKADTELIRQMLDALERRTKHNDADYEAITAARARLEQS